MTMFIKVGLLLLMDYQDWDDDIDDDDDGDNDDKVGLPPLESIINVEMVTM